jgi:hypothetical protein
VTRIRRELAQPLARWGFTALAGLGLAAGTHLLAACSALLAAAGWYAHRPRKARRR